MPFHRFVDPTYHLLGGAFPGAIGAQTYDRVNVASGGTGGGGTANADAAKVGGPNAGTYFVAFGEDATSSFANRGLRALAENTDFLDNVVRSSIPGWATHSAPLVSASELQIIDDVFTGDAPSLAASNLVSLEDASTGLEPVSSTGQRVFVTGFYESTNTVLVTGTGFQTNPYLRLNVPFTGTLVVRYGSRTSLAKTVEDPSLASRFLGMWALANSSRLTGLYRHGLDERYRRSTTVSSQGGLLDITPNVAGAGGTIYRDGSALIVLHPNQDYWVAAPPDPYMALFRAGKVPTLTGTADQTRGGAIGFQSLYDMRTLPGEEGDAGDNYADFIAMGRRNIVSDTVGLGTAYTRVPVEAPCILNPGGVSSSILQLTDASHYWSRDEGGVTVTGARSTFDLVLVTWGGATRLLKIYASIVPGAYNQIYVANITGPGTGPFLGLNNEPATVTWIQPHFWVNGQGLWPMFFGQPAYNSDDLDTLFVNPPVFLAGSKYEHHASFTTDGRVNRALSWGGFDKRSATTPVGTGVLFGDGSIGCTRVEADLHSVPPMVSTISTPDGSATLNAYKIGTYAQDATGFHLLINIYPGATGAITVNVNLFNGVGTMTEGTRCTVVVDCATTDPSSIAINWGGDVPFSFSGSDGQIPPGVAAAYKWEGVLSYMGGSARMLMTRTDYT